MYQLLVDKKWSPARHIALVLFIAINFVGITFPPFSNIMLNNELQLRIAFKYLGFFFFLISVIFVYVNFFIFIPKYLLTNKYNQYILALVLASVIYFILQTYLTNHYLFDFRDLIPPTKYDLIGYLETAIVPLAFLTSCAGYKIFMRSLEEHKKFNDLKELQLKNELTNLKNQINPHFLFNTLNNLHTLMNKDLNKASQVVLGLSDILRYQLYETSFEHVSLSKEIDIIQYILEIERIRRDHCILELKTHGSTANIFIPPSIYLNFIENAIKHSVDNLDTSYIHIEFNIADDRIKFNCLNSKSRSFKAKTFGGIGLQNIKRRLELIYKDTYTLEIVENEIQYQISLTLPITSKI